MESYMECFHVDLAAFDKLLTQEINNKREDLTKAEKAAQELTVQMSGALQNSEH
mgnify:CR=1 FL=1